MVLYMETHSYCERNYAMKKIKFRLLFLFFLLSLPFLSLEAQWFNIPFNSVAFRATPHTWSATQTYDTIIVNQIKLIGYIYVIGDESTEGSWRYSATLSGDMIYEYRASGMWVTKLTITK